MHQDHEELQNFLFKKRHEETTTMMMTTAACAALHKCKNVTESSQTSGVTCQELSGAQLCWLTGDSAAQTTHQAGGRAGVTILFL